MGFFLNSDITKLTMTFLLLPLFINYILNAKFYSTIFCDMSYRSYFKMSIPATIINNFHVKRCWEFNVFLNGNVCEKC